MHARVMNQTFKSCSWFVYESQVQNLFVHVVCHYTCLLNVGVQSSAPNPPSTTEGTRKLVLLLYIFVS